MDERRRGVDAQQGVPHLVKHELQYRLLRLHASFLYRRREIVEASDEQVGRHASIMEVVDDLHGLLVGQVYPFEGNQDRDLLPIAGEHLDLPPGDSHRGLRPSV